MCPILSASRRWDADQFYVFILLEELTRRLKLADLLWPRSPCDCSVVGELNVNPAQM
jgi:hypothetical protein